MSCRRSRRCRRRRSSASTIKPTPSSVASRVSIDYLVRPADVLREVRRVLVPGARVVITFSNRCFPTKAVAAWQALDDSGHVRLVRHYLDAAGPWSTMEALRAQIAPGGDPLYGVAAAK